MTLGHWNRSLTPESLRSLRRALGSVPAREAMPEIGAILDRLDRDLLPRTAGGHDHLVVGIVGPNNAGKSALFNSLVAGLTSPGEPAPEPISPSLPVGGATRRLVGVAHPVLRAALEGEATLSQFLMRGVIPAAGVGVEAATETAEEGRAHELLLVESEELPESLLLVDTPDFDSVLAENRLVTDALLTVADVAVVVVTRHTYQNHDVIEFLRHWLDHGRPWALVYNESIDEETTLAHAAKLEADIGCPPEAVFQAPFDLDIAKGNVGLVPTRIFGAPVPRRDGSSPVESQAGESVRAWLDDMGSREELKARALAASTAALVDELESLGSAIRSEEASAAAVLGLVAARSEALGREVAREAMPMGPFLEAFREVLDERPTLVQRELRRGLKWTGRTMAQGARWAGSVLRGGSAAEGDDGPVTSTLLDLERRELEARWTTFFEPALRDLRDAVRAGELTPRVGALVAELTGRAPNVFGSLGHALDALALDPELMAEYRVACRELITKELDSGRSEWALQLAVDGLHLLPIGVAGAVIVHTGGLGADVAVAGGGAVSAALAERLSRALGTGVAASARKSWTDLRSSKIAHAAAEGLLMESGPELESLVEGLGELTKAIDAALSNH